MLELAAIVFIVMTAWAVVAAAAILLKTVVWLILLPFRLLFAVLVLPLLLIKAIVGGLLMVIVLPLLAVAGIVAGVISGIGLAWLASRYFTDVRTPGAVTLIAAAAVLVAAAILASLMPAARASRVDVIEALRAD